MDETPLSPDLFIFKRMVMDMLDHCKKTLRTSPFDDMAIEELVANNKLQRIDIYHQYFLIGLGHPKTREFISKKYDHLIRENLVNKDFLPPNMITGIINARAAVGVGSTASSGSGSVVGSSQQMQTEKSVHLGKLVATIICSTLQPASQICNGLNYVLQGTRSKTYGTFFYSLMEEIYTSLCKYRQKPIDRFLQNFLSSIVSEVEFHELPYLKYEKSLQKEEESTKSQLTSHKKLSPPEIFNYINRKTSQKQQKLCVHNTSQSKFGKCFMCDRWANNYDKNLFVPLCGMDCKNKLKRVNDECVMNDHFSMLNWLMEMLLQNGCGNNDEIVYVLILKELPEVELGRREASLLMQALINKISIGAVGGANTSGVMGNKICEHSIMIFTHIFRKYPQMMMNNAVRFSEQQPFPPYQDLLPNFIDPSLIANFHFTKIFLLQIVRMLELLPILNSTLQLTLLKCLTDCLSISDGELCVFREFYTRCDCSLFEFNLVERILNVVSQYGISGGSSGMANDALSMGFVGGAVAGGIGSGDSIDGVAVVGVEGILGTLVGFMEMYQDVTFYSNFGEIVDGCDLYLQKQTKKYLQTEMIELFNKKPVKAIDKLTSLLPDMTAQDIAIWIRNNLDYESKLKKSQPTITKITVGEFFGHRKPLNQQVYGQFLKLIEPQFEGLEIDDCLRILFNTFSLPKEAQQIQVIFEKLSLVLEDYMGLKKGNQGTATYQFIMAALMVQTSTNPNVKEKQKLKLEDFKGLCSRIDGGVSESRVIQVFNRINKRPLETLMEYPGAKLFTLKYLSYQLLQTKCWYGAIQRIEKQKEVDRQEEEKKKREKEKDAPEKEKPKMEEQASSPTKPQSSILTSSNLMVGTESVMDEEREETSLQYTMYNIWPFLYMAVINKNNLRGLEYSCVLYGRCELRKQFEPFFNHLQKIHSELSEKSTSSLQNQSHQAMLIILKLAIEYGNYVLGVKSWLIIINLIYKRDHDDTRSKLPSHHGSLQNSYNFYEYESSDKLFTRTKNLSPQRLKQFLEAMCEFSSSEITRDKSYTREMYILHHITEIIEYNLRRLEEEQGNIWLIVWPTIRNYFRNICVHPRKDIAMSAIDSYKQLTMKIVKLNNPQIRHRELMSIYLYVFERSPAILKDLITNVLLNVVSREIKEGWDEIYTILDISDSEDKGVVMRVVNRMVQDIGLDYVGNLIRLHQILIKQLRIAAGERVDEVIERLWQVSLFFNRMDIWLETLTFVKDIYKATTNPLILQFLYRLCNACIKCLKSLRQGYEGFDEEQSEQNSQSERRKLSSNISESNHLQVPQIESVEDLSSKISEDYIEEVLQRPNSLNMNNNNNNAHKFPPELVHNLIYKEVLEAQIHIMEISSVKVFVEAVTCFKKLDLEILFKNLGNRERFQTGFISLWEMFLSSHHSVPFCYFLRDYFLSLLPTLNRIYENLSHQQNNEEFYGIRSVEQIRGLANHLITWSLKLFIDSNTDSILELCKDDQELRLDYHDLLTKAAILSGNNKVELIEFSLSSKDYEQKSIQHLVFLNIIKIFFEARMVYVEANVREKIFNFAMESYEVSWKVNEKPLLRNFLWNNDFLKGKEEYLPGLMKQEIRSYEFLVKYSPLNEATYQIFFTFLQRYASKLKSFINLLNTIKKEEKSESQANISDSVSNIKFKEILLQDIGLWLTNHEQNLTLTFKRISESIEIEGQEKKAEKVNPEKYTQLFNVCLALSGGVLNKSNLQKCSNLLQLLIKVIY